MKKMTKIEGVNILVSSEIEIKKVRRPQICNDMPHTLFFIKEERDVKSIINMDGWHLMLNVVMPEEFSSILRFFPSPFNVVLYPWAKADEMEKKLHEIYG